MKFTAPCPEIEVRSLLESLAKKNTSSANKLILKVPSELLTDKFGLQVSVIYHKNTHNVTVQGPATIVDKAMLNLELLMTAYHEFLKSDGKNVLPLDRCMTTAQTMWRIPAYSEFMNTVEADEVDGCDTVKQQTTLMLSPDCEEYTAAVTKVVECAYTELAAFPEWQQKLMKILKEEFGLTSTASWFTIGEADMVDTFGGRSNGPYVQT